jgi:magnesium chelatase subunit D
VDARLAFRRARRRNPFIHSKAGKREEVVISRRRGKYSRSRLPQGHAGDVALDATLRAAAGRLSTAQARKLEIRSEDLRQKVRRHRSPYVIAFVVDNSWSMHVETTLERTKGVVMELLKDARTHHDKVALIAFRHNRRPDATICLPPTTSYALAARRLETVPLSGTTPLPDGIRKAYHLLRQERIKYRNAIPTMVIITDGLPNIPIRAGEDPYEEVSLLCRHLRWDGIATVVVDTEPSGPATGRSYCREMAALSGGVLLPLSRLTRQSIEAALAHSGGTRRPPAPEGKELLPAEEIQ